MTWFRDASVVLNTASAHIHDRPTAKHKTQPRHCTMHNNILRPFQAPQASTGGVGGGGIGRWHCGAALVVLYTHCIWLSQSLSTRHGDSS